MDRGEVEGKQEGKGEGRGEGAGEREVVGEGDGVKCKKQCKRVNVRAVCCGKSERGGRVT